MKLLGDATLEISYFEMVDAVEQYLLNKFPWSKVAWVVSADDVKAGTIPYQGSYRVQLTEVENAGDP